MNLDLIGLECPEPVIRTKRELDKVDLKVVTSTVDNEVAKENLKKLAESLGYSSSVKNVGSDFEVTIIKEAKDDISLEPKREIGDNDVILFTKNYFGADEELGKVLIKSFIYTVSESSNLPKRMLFVNNSVKLVCEEGDILNDLKKLEEKGVEIAACGLCLDFFKLKEDVKVGSITNMYDIYETAKKADRLIEI